MIIFCLPSYITFTILILCFGEFWIFRNLYVLFKILDILKLFCLYFHLRTAALQLITDKPKLTENLPRWRLLASLPCLNQTLSCHFVGREELIALCAHSYNRHKIMEKPNQSDLQ